VTAMASSQTFLQGHLEECMKHEWWENVIFMTTRKNWWLGIIFWETQLI